MTNSKVPTKLRQRYLDSFIDEILKVTLDPHTVYKKAEEEEEQLFQHCSSRMTYCSRASHTLQRLRYEAVGPYIRLPYTAVWSVCTGGRLWSF